MREHRAHAASSAKVLSQTSLEDSDMQALGQRVHGNATLSVTESGRFSLVDQIMQEDYSPASRPLPPKVSQLPTPLSMLGSTITWQKGVSAVLSGSTVCHSTGWHLLSPFNM